MPDGSPWRSKPSHPNIEIFGKSRFLRSTTHFLSRSVQMLTKERMIGNKPLGSGWSSIAFSANFGSHTRSLQRYCPKYQWFPGIVYAVWWGACYQRQRGEEPTWWPHGRCDKLEGLQVVVSGGVLCEKAGSGDSLMVHTRLYCRCDYTDLLELDSSPRPTTVPPSFSLIAVSDSSPKLI